MTTIKYFTKLVGVTFEGRQDIIATMSPGTSVRLRREADNEYDALAVAVDAEINGLFVPIGYIAKDKNTELANLYDSGGEAKISVGSITGGPSEAGNKSYGVNVSIEYEVDDSNEVEAGEKKDYFSKIIGKSTKVTVVNGHVRLPGYLSGSAFPNKFYREFDREGVLDALIAKHYGDKSEEDKKVIRESIENMWGLNGLASTSIGTGVHAAMENYDEYYVLGDKMKSVKTYKTKAPEIGPNKALSKNPFIKKIVEDFHEKFGGDYKRLSEQFIWLHDEKMCGSVDRIKIIDEDKKIIRIQDFKTDGDIHEKRYQLTESPFYKLTQGDTPKMGKELLDLHWLQLSFYAYILTKYGYTVEGLDVYWLNPEKLVKGENAWEEFSHDVIDIKEGL